MIDGSDAPDLDEDGAALDDDLLILVNGWWEPVTCTLGRAGGAPVVIESDSFDPSRAGAQVDGGTLLVGARSVVLVRFG